jgi:hypothetical protein
VVIGVIAGGNLSKPTYREKADREGQYQEKSGWGDSLVCCVYCGTVRVGVYVVNSIRKLHAYTARDVFKGETCAFCLKAYNVDHSQYRMVLAPVQLPNILDAKKKEKEHQNGKIVEGGGTEAGEDIRGEEEDRVRV